MWVSNNNFLTIIFWSLASLSSVHTLLKTSIQQLLYNYFLVTYLTEFRTHFVENINPSTSLQMFSGHLPHWVPHTLCWKHQSINFFTNVFWSLTSLSSAHTLLKASIQRFLAGEVSWKVCCSGSYISKELSTYSWVLCRLTLEEDTRLLAGLLEDTWNTGSKSKQWRKMCLHRHSIFSF